MTIKDNLTREEAAERAALVSNLRYDVSLDQTTGPDAYRCEVVIRFDASSPGAETFLDFVGGTIESATLNGRELPSSIHDGERIHLESLESGNELRITTTVTYSGTGVGIHRFEDPVDGRVYMHSDYEPFDAHRAFPCFDQPDLKGRFRFSVRVPEGSLAVSNGAPEGDPVPDGDGAVRWTFTETPAISPYITALVTGPFHVQRQSAGGIEMALWCRQSMAEHLARSADELFEVTRQGFEYFQERFDYPYPFGAKYDQLFVPDFLAGAMENAACVTFNELYLFRSKVTDAARERRAETVLHELAHMWFGDLVTMRWWDDVWLNESFATYVSTRALAEATRFHDGWVSFADGEKTWAYQQDQLPTTHAITTDVPDTQSIRLNFDGITYAKGASVLKQLAAWVGDDAFIDGLRAYFRRHEWGNTTLADFLSALEETSGRDLRAWSAEWLETPGLNTLRAVFEETRRDRRRRRSGRSASSSTAPDDWPLAALAPARDRAVRRRATDTSGAATRVEVDVPEGRGHPGAGRCGHSRADAGERRRPDVLEDPAGRALDGHAARADLGGSATRSPARSAGRPRGTWCVTPNCPPSGTSTWSFAIRPPRATSARSSGCWDRRARRSTCTATRGCATSGWIAWPRRPWPRLNAAEPGSERQLAWARAWASSAGSDDDARVLRGLLDGSAAVPGLDVDTELRWHLVGVAGLAGHGRRAATSRPSSTRDPTSQGRDHAEAARAARPSAEAKEAAWTSFLPDAASSATHADGGHRRVPALRPA